MVLKLSGTRKGPLLSHFHASSLDITIYFWLFRVEGWLQACVASEIPCLEALTVVS